MKKLSRLFFLMLIPIGQSLFGGCVVFKSFSGAQTEPLEAPQASLQSILDTSINEYKLPGLQAGILHHGQAPILAASGTTDVGRRGPRIDLRSSFRVGSTTKMFVAALVCRMAEQGLLNLDDTIEKWFPDYPQASTIRIRDLLNHTSGIRESLFTDGGMMVVSMLNTKKLWDPAEVLKVLGKKSKPTVLIDRHFVYANDNYILLGLIAERAAGASLAPLLESEFFDPLNMKDTCLLPWSRRLPDGTVPGYDEFIPFGPHLITKDQTSWDSLTFAAGALSSSAADLLLWLDAFFHDGIVSKSSFEMMRDWVPANDNGRDNSIVAYGLGIAQYWLDGVILEGHPGGGFGGECYPFYDPIKDTSYVVVYNVFRKDNPAGKAILQKMLSF